MVLGEHKSKQFERFIGLIKDNEGLVYNKGVAELLGIVYLRVGSSGIA